MKEPLTFAQVGAEKPMRGLDFSGQIKVIEWIHEHCPDLLIGKKITHDIINLTEGRDFLKEQHKTYDIVVLHTIFHTNMEDRIDLTQQSSLHSVANWRKRLILSYARLIFVLRFAPCSLEGWHLGQLDRYKRTMPDPEMTVYQKA